MSFFGPSVRNGLPIGLGSIAGFGVQQFSPADLFAAGEQGFWYDPSDYSTLFQDSAGTTPVTAVEQAVGLMLDKSASAGTGYYSGYFDGTGDWLSWSGTTLAGDFTAECWVYKTAVDASGYTNVFSGGSNQQFFIDLTTPGSIGLVINGAVIIPASGTAVALNAWRHLAWVREGNTCRVYVNGVQQGTGTSSASTSINTVGAFAGSYEMNGYISNVRIVSGTCLYPGGTTFTPPTAPLTAISGTQLLTCQNNYFKDNSSNAFAITVNGNAAPNLLNPFNATAARSVNNAFQTTSAKRPVLRARYNLLTFSEQFDNGVWVKNSSSVSANSTVAPNGTTTADTFTSSAAAASHNLQYNGLSAYSQANSNFTAIVSVKAGTHNFVTLSFTSGSADAWAAVTVDLSTGTATKTGNGVNGTLVGTPTVISQGNGWYQVVLTARYASGAGTYVFISSNSSGTPTYGSYGLETWTPAGTETILVWGADLRPASQATGLIGPTYQRIAAATDYDTTGFLPYLQFDGVDDAMTTNSIDFTATDKMTVWAGYRIASGTSSQTLAELTTNGFTTNGGFNVGQGPNAGTSGFGFLMNNGAGIAGETAAITVPYSSVISYQFDSALSGLTNEAKLRRDQVAQTYASTTGSDSGTGNFANAPLFIGARNQTVGYLNGWLTSLIGRGAATSAGQISATEQWVNGKTGAY